MAALTTEMATLLQAVSALCAEAVRNNPALLVHANHGGARVNTRRTFSIAGAPGMTFEVSGNAYLDQATWFDILGVLDTGNFSGPALAVSGTLSDGAANADIVAGGQTMIWTLTNNTWAADVATNKEKAHALIRTLQTAALATDWNAIVVPAILAAWETALVRTSDTVLTLTLPPVAGYSVADTDETVVITYVPPFLLTQEVFMRDSNPTSAAIDNTA